MFKFKMKFSLFFIIFLKLSSTEQLDSPKLLFVAYNHIDMKNLTIFSNFNAIFNTNYFNPNKLSVLVIHGFGGSYGTGFSKIVVDAFLTRTEFNIMYADWSRKASKKYLDVVHDIPDVSLILGGLFLNDDHNIRFFNSLPLPVAKISFKNFSFV